MPVPFRLYNSLTRSSEQFNPIEHGKVRLYVCGMTVYDHAHIGHARAMVVFDAFVRWHERVPTGLRPVAWAGILFALFVLKPYGMAATIYFNF